MNYFSNFHLYQNLKTNGKCWYTRDLMCMTMITIVNKLQAKNCVGFNNLPSPTYFRPTSNSYGKYLAFNCKDQKCSFKASFIYRSRMNFTIPRFSHKGGFLKYFVRWPINYRQGEVRCQNMAEIFSSSKGPAIIDFWGKGQKVRKIFWSH